MRIEIISGVCGGTSTISGLYTDFESLIAETDSTISTLNKMRSWVYSMSGGIGILNNAVDNMEVRLKTEESKKTSLLMAKEKCDSFFQLVSTTEESVANIVSKNRDEFLYVNKWARPSLLYGTIESWYKKGLVWFKRQLKDGEDLFSHNLNIILETNFSELSEEEIKDYFENLKSKNINGKFNSDDRIRLQSLLNYLLKGSFSDKSLLFEVFFVLNFDEMKKIDDDVIRKGYGYEKSNWIKYFMIKGTSLSAAEKLYEKWANKNNSIGDMTFINESDDGFKQGNFYIVETTVIKKIDGSCDFSFSARQTPVAKSYGLAIVYDSNGNIVEVKVLDRYHNPITPIDACKTIWNSWNNKDYSETNVTVNIPKGGYIQITDDPDEISIIQTGMIIKEEVEDQIKDAIKQGVKEWIKEETGIGKVGKHATDKVKYRSEIIAAAKEAYEITKATTEVVDKIEDIYFTSRQKGSGSAIIYND